MDDLVRWLGEQLDAEEAEARLTADAFGAVWTTDDAMESVSSDTGADVVTEPYAPRSFIAEHDPARVLREIEAKRRMITEVAAAHASAIDMEHACCHDPEQILAGECEQHAPNDLPLLRLLALPYAGQPGYEESWAP